MRLHYFLLFLSAYAVACLMAWSAPSELTNFYRAFGLLLAVIGGGAFGKWFYTFKPSEAPHDCD